MLCGHHQSCTAGILHFNKPHVGLIRGNGSKAFKLLDCYRFKSSEIVKNKQLPSLLCCCVCVCASVQFHYTSGNQPTRGCPGDEKEGKEKMNQNKRED